MTLFQILFLLYALISPISTAWIQTQGNNRRMRSEKYNIRLHDQDKNRVDIESRLSNDMKNVDRVFNTPRGRLIHIPGLFESLSSLPVHNWVDPSFDDMVCRDDDCEKECEIPDEWKESIHTDVLGFLGIKRVKPLNIRKKLQ
jgi:hypothetical protein